MTEKHHHESDATFELADWGGKLAEKRSLLADLAAHYDAGEGPARGGSSCAWLQPAPGAHSGADQADAELDTFVRAMRERGSLLDERDGALPVHPPHLPGISGRLYPAETVRDADRIVAFWRKMTVWPDSWWRETVLLTVGTWACAAPTTLTVVKKTGRGWADACRWRWRHGLAVGRAGGPGQSRPGDAHVGTRPPGAVAGRPGPERARCGARSRRTRPGPAGDPFGVGV
ncbi:MAG: hypothetical protein R3A10_02780 [Caldilineaceae bacterium]